MQEKNQQKHTPISQMSKSQKKTQLSIKRTMLAATRTLLSHFRTTAVIISLAFAFMKLNGDKPIDAFTIILFVLSGIFFVTGFVDFFVTKYYVNNLFSDDNDAEADADNE